MIPYARLRPGPGFHAGRIGLYYAQRLAVQPRLRRAVARAIARLIGLRHPDDWGPLAPPDTAIAALLRHEGIAPLPGLVPPEKAERIAQCLRDQPMLLPDGRPAPTGTAAARTAMAFYPLKTLVNSQDVLGLVTAAPVLRLAAAYLGCTPTLSGLSAYWSYPVAAPALYTQRFHRDLDDWRFVKLFVYLTDVDHGTGPHVYVRQSHLRAARLRTRPYSRQAVDRYGRDKVLTVLGLRGTAFMADTYGVHLGKVPTQRPRLLLQAQYSLLPVFAFDYTPVAAATPADLDVYVTRLLIQPR